MRSGFSFIEVIVSAILCSIIGLALLQMNSDQTKALGYLKQKNGTNQLSSMSIFLSDENRTQMPAYDLFAQNTTLTNDTIIESLSNLKIESIKKENITRVELDPIFSVASGKDSDKKIATNDSILVDEFSFAIDGQYFTFFTFSLDIQ